MLLTTTSSLWARVVEYHLLSSSSNDVRFCEGRFTSCPEYQLELYTSALEGYCTGTKPGCTKQFVRAVH
jgi:hypothetical protein